MYARLQDLMVHRLSLLMSDRHQELAGEYLYPFPIYMGGRQHVVRAPQDMEVALRRLHLATRHAGVHRIEPRIQALELPREGRFRVWVAHANLNAAGEVLSRGEYIHYCRLLPEGIRTEMSDYPTCRTDWLTMEKRRIPA